MSYTNAEQASGITPGALPKPVRDLFAAIAEALDVPLPSIDDTDERAYHRLLERRASDVRIHLITMLEFGDVDISRDASGIRARTATMPVTYALHDAPACGRCGKPFITDDTRFDGHARHKVTPYCRRCVDNCHEGGTEHVCPICDPARYRGESR